MDLNPCTIVKNGLTWNLLWRDESLESLHREQQLPHRLLQVFWLEWIDYVSAAPDNYRQRMLLIAICVGAVGTFQKKDARHFCEYASWLEKS